MPNKDLIESRKRYVGSNRGSGKSDAQLRRQFFVRTRMQELRAEGKNVGAGTRKRLLERYKSGKVKRSEFYAGGEKEQARRRAATAKSKPTAGTKPAATKPSAPKVIPPKPKPSKYGSPESALGASRAKASRLGTPEAALAKNKSMQPQNPSARNRRSAYGSPESAMSAAKARKAAAAKKSKNTK